MKIQILMTAALAACVVLGQANAEEKELSKPEAPKAVLEVFEKTYPTV